MPPNDLEMETDLIHGTGLSIALSEFYFYCQKCKLVYVAASQQHGRRCICGGELKEWPK
jgi:hypothetical protein